MAETEKASDFAASMLIWCSIEPRKPPYPPIFSENDAATSKPALPKADEITDTLNAEIDSTFADNIGKSLWTTI